MAARLSLLLAAAACAAEEQGVSTSRAADGASPARGAYRYVVSVPVSGADAAVRLHVGPSERRALAALDTYTVSCIVTCV